MENTGVRLWKILDKMLYAIFVRFLHLKFLEKRWDGFMQFVKFGVVNYDEAMEYYEEFVEMAPNDSLKFVLKYKIYKAKGESLAEQIQILEDLKEQEYIEEWAYELAYLYHQAGMSEKCVEACDELILWFGDGAYVEKALELKMLYQPLTKQQEEKYRQFRQKRDGVVEVRPNDMLNSGEIVSEVVKIPQVTMNASRFNTVNLQNELAKNMQQIMDATEKEEVNDSMDAIKKMVEEIPYLQLPHESEEQKEEKYEYRQLSDPGPRRHPGRLSQKPLREAFPGTESQLSPLRPQKRQRLLLSLFLGMKPSLLSLRSTCGSCGSFQKVPDLFFHFSGVYPPLFHSLHPFCSSFPAVSLFRFSFSI